MKITRKDIKGSKFIIQEGILRKDKNIRFTVLEVDIKYLKILKSDIPFKWCGFKYKVPIDFFMQNACDSTSPHTCYHIYGYDTLEELIVNHLYILDF